MYDRHYWNVPNSSVQEELSSYLPVLVEPSFAFLSNVFSPYSLQGTKASGSFNVSNNTNNNDGRSLQDCDALHNLLLVNLGARSVHVSDDVSHASLVSHEASQVYGLGSVILGEALDLSPESLGPLLGEEPL